MKNFCFKWPLASWVLLGPGIFHGARAQTAAPPATVAPAGTAPVATAGGNRSGAPTSTTPVTIPELHAGGKIYYEVKVFQVTPKDVVISHRGGLGSVPLADLPVEWQQKLGYEPAKAAAATAAQEAAAAAKRVQSAGAAPGSAVSRILQSFTQPPKILQAISLRPRFEALGIGADHPGASLSSAIFTVVSALEYQMAPAMGPAPKLSDDSLIWATLKVSGQAGVRLPKVETPGFDIGFTLVDVVQALSTYGSALEEEWPYRITVQDPSIKVPAVEVIDLAKRRIPANGFLIKGADAAARIGQIVQVLNEGVPVLAEVNWPSEEDVQKSPVLDAQAGRNTVRHSILIVGYQSKAGKLDDVEFLFRNSAGVEWGGQGFGLVTYRYLEKNLNAGFFMDVR